MALSKHIDVDDLLAKSREHPIHKHKSDRQEYHDVPYLSRYNADMEVPKYRLPSRGIDGRAVYQLLHDELDLDGGVNLNLASFVGTFLTDEAKKLCEENLMKNLVDQDEYPAAQAIHERCVSMLADLWHAPAGSKAIGTATTGSSEAIMLGGLALKKRWQAKMKAAGKSIHEPGPNIVMGNEAQVALEKFARYWDVECRLVPVDEESRYVMSAKNAMQFVDENTIGIFVILGSTYTGHFENVKEFSDSLDEYERKTGNHIPIHVDAASGGFVAPFAYPDYVWDFKLPRVQSINASGHKYGLSPVGVGWIVWRGEEYLPKELIFELHYLGSVEYSFNLNFSRPAHPIIAQMFNFLNLGFEGYRNIALGDLKKARLLCRALEGSGYYEVLSDIHRPKSAVEGIVNVVGQGVEAISHGRAPYTDKDAEFYTEGLPVVSFRFTDEIKEKYPNLKQSWMQEQLRKIGWIVPNYALPPKVDNVEILRVVVRESLNGDLVDKLIEDILTCTESLLDDEGPSPSMSRADRRLPNPRKKASEGGKSAPSQGTYGRPC